MKKILFILLLALSVSCATTKTTSTQYDYITLEKAHGALAGCDDTNGGRWWMNIGGVQVAVMHLENCLGIDRVLVMITDTNSHTPEIRRHSYKLLGLHFLEHMKVSQPNKAWTLEQIKEFDVGASEEEPGKWFVIYKVNSARADCAGGTCRRSSEN